MRQILILFAVFAAGLLIGRGFWPQSHPDPAYHFRFHRGHLPHTVEPEPSPLPRHGRILQPAPVD